jgi:medium-chain acyl-[acyl-carrier-protein] hydrolase
MKAAGADSEAQFVQHFSVRMHETDHAGRLRLTSLLNYFQDAAGEHAEKLGAGVIELLRLSLTWVLSRYHIRIFRYLRWTEPVELTTWPSVNKGLFALREFEARDKKGEIFAAATTSWMLIDLKTTRPVSPAERLGRYLLNPKRAVPSDFEPLPVSGPADFEKSFEVRMSDLDWNRHANHVAYISWSLETASPDFLEKFRPAEVEADFRGQAFCGGIVVCRAQTVSPAEAPAVLYQIIEADKRKELARLRVVWRA